MKEAFVLGEKDRMAMRRYGLAPEKLTGCSVCSKSVVPIPYGQTKNS